tara:strand:+ start:7816 stop:9357 length:1542 start_codon:yes stop_codon:yes gene_type:complete
MSIGKITVDIPINDTATLMRVLAVLDGATAPPGTGAPATPVPTPDGNVYPLTMAPVTTPGDPVTIGVGPDVIQMRLNAGTTLGDTATIAVFVNDMRVAAPLTVTGHAGMSDGQIFSIHGSFGVSPHVIDIIGTGAGDEGLWINSVAVNDRPLVYNGGPLDNRATQPPPNSPGVWNNRGLPVRFGPFTAVAPPVVVEPTAPSTPPSVITARINGVTQTGTLGELVASLSANDILTLPEGIFHGTAAIMVPCTIQGAGVGRTILDGTGMRPTYDKACLVPTVPGVTIKALTIRHWHIPASIGGNAAGVRNGGDGIAFTLETVEVTQCDNGLLTFGAPNVVILNCLFHGNGVGAGGGGATHEQYFGGGEGSSVIETDVVVSCGPKSAHALKSRSAGAYANGCLYTGNNFDPEGAYAGAVTDFPNGGIVSLRNSRLTIPPNDGNRIFLNYGVDALLYSENKAALLDCILEDQTGRGGIIAAHKPDMTLDVTGTVYTGEVPPQMVGWAKVVGEIVKAP